MASLTKQMAVLFFGRVVAFSFMFFAPIVLVRIWSPAEFGLYKQLFMLHSTVFAILPLGLTLSLYYFVPRHPPHERNVIVNQTMILLALLGLVAALGMVVLKSQLARALNNPDLEQYIPVLAAFTGLSLVASMLEHLMISLKQINLSTITSVCSDFLRASILIGAAVITHRLDVIVWAMVIWGAGRAIALVWYLRSLGIPWRLIPQRESLKEQFRYSLPLGLSTIVFTLAYTLDQYAVSYMFNPALFAIYSVGCLQIPLVWILYSSVCDVALVQVTELRHHGHLEEAGQLIGSSVTKILLLFGPATVWLMVNARDIITVLYTARFEASVDIFRVSLFTIPIGALGLDYVLRAFGETGFMLRVYLIQVGLLAVLLMILPQQFGLVGAALALVVAMGASHAAILLKVRSLLKMRLVELLPWRRLGYIVIASFIAGAVSWGIVAWADLTGVTRLVLSACTFSLCYAGLVWKMGLIELNEKRWLISKMESCYKNAAGTMAVKAK